jgi:4-aminobutyrate aminotransferase/(S)-3-amino-2-methylpropionate transaminase
MGAMAAFELVNNKTDRTPNPELAAALCKKAREEGLILLSCGMYGNTIRFLMPVTIEDDVLNEGLDIIESCLESLI